MPATRRSRLAKAADLQMHEALVSGLSPEQVAERFKQPVVVVLAAERRVLAERAKLGPDEALRQEQLENLRMARKEAMTEFQRARREEEVGTKSSMETTKEGQRAERTTRTKPASASYLRVIATCVTTELKVQASAKAARAAASSPAPASAAAAASAPAPAPSPATAPATTTCIIDGKTYTVEVPKPGASMAYGDEVSVPHAELPEPHASLVRGDLEAWAALVPPDSNLHALVTLTGPVKSTTRVPLRTLYNMVLREHPQFDEFQHKLSETMYSQKLPFLDPKSPYFWKKTTLPRDGPLMQ